MSVRKKLMKKLTKREDQIVQIVWKLQKAFIRDIVAEFPDPPHYNTVATLVKILVDKGVLQAQKVGNAYQYSPTQKVEAYVDEQIDTIKTTFFNNSLPKMLAHFAKGEKLSKAEKEELIRIIQSQSEE